MVKTETNQWYDFYKKRVNSSYQAYFEHRYFPFLNHVLQKTKANGNLAIDAGCGIGSVSKYLNKYGVTNMGFDSCPMMVELAKENLPGVLFREKSLFDNSYSELTVTHGVLEHFEDYQIKDVLNKYPNSVHYVPLQGYPAPSFGDERLLPLEYWVMTFNLTEYETFNNGLDLYFTINNV